MALEDKKIEFMKKFEQYSGSRFEVCYDIYLGLMNNDEADRIELLSYACNNFGIKDSDGSFSPRNSGVSKHDLDDLRKTYGQTVDTLLDTLVQKGITSSMPIDTFYHDIWHLIVQNPIFPSEKEKVFALYYVLIDPKIPYCPIASGLSMNNSEFRNIIDECYDAIRKVKFILAVDFPQKTMEASNLLDIILSQHDYNKQVVILSKIITELRQKDKEIIDALMKKLQGEE